MFWVRQTASGFLCAFHPSKNTSPRLGVPLSSRNGIFARDLDDAFAHEWTSSEEVEVGLWPVGSAEVAVGRPVYCLVFVLVDRGPSAPCWAGRCGRGCSWDPYALDLRSSVLVPGTFKCVDLGNKS